MKKLVLFAIASLMSVSASARNPSETAKLYPTPQTTPSPYCDVHTRMTIDHVQQVIRLENRVDGVCELFVAPNPRTFTINSRSNDCGSTVYRGVMQTQTGAATIQVTDNRGRRCENVIEDQIVVQVTTGNKVQQLFGRMGR